MSFNRRMAGAGLARRGLRAPAVQASTSATLASILSGDLYLHYDSTAAGALTVTSEPDVDQIADETGGGHPGVAPASQKPTRSGTELTFDNTTGTDDCFRVREPSGLSIARGTLLMVGLYTRVTIAIPNLRMLWSMSAPSDAGAPSQLIYEGTVPEYEFQAGMAASGAGTSTRNIQTGRTLVSGYHLVMQYIGDEEHWGEISGTRYEYGGSMGGLSGIGNAGIANLGNCNSALYDSYGWPHDGDFEFFIATGARTEADVTAIKDYFTAKYGAI
jgi:hypothetical protein